jgi:hypothetical protein
MDISAGKKMRELTATRANKKINRMIAGNTFCLMNCIVIKVIKNLLVGTGEISH